MSASRTLCAVPPDPPEPIDKSLLASLRDAFISNGYTHENVDALVPRDSIESYGDGWFNPIRYRTKQGDPLATLTRLFRLGLEVSVDDLAAVPGPSVSDWIRSGLVETRRSAVRPLVAMQTLEIAGQDVYLACDARRPGAGGPPFEEYVIGMNPWAWRLARMMLRRPFHRALDMGTGAGIHSMLAAHHCEEVIAVDLNSRALSFARFNLAWNEVQNVQLRQGDRYAPVAGEEFDLIVANLPIVVSPSMVARFRDSGLPTDSMSATAVAGAAEHLAPGGWAFVTCQWVYLDGERWQDRVEAWVAGTDCDAWAVQHETQDPVAHTTEELRELGRVDPKEADRQFEKWMRYLDGERIVGVGYGFVVLHRRKGSVRPWFSTYELPREFADGSGEAIAGYFETHDWIDDHRAAGAVLDARWRVAEHAQLERMEVAQNQRWVVTGRKARQTGGWLTSVDVSDDLADTILRCDGSRDHCV